jgi:2'-5' RNA ligase
MNQQNLLFYRVSDRIQQKVTGGVRFCRKRPFPLVLFWLIRQQGRYTMAQGVVSVLDQQHYQTVANLWEEMRQRFGVGDPEKMAVPHFSYHVAEQYDEENLAVILREVAGEKRPFTITASGIGIFPAPNPIVYVPLVRTAELTQLHTKLWPRLEAIAQDSYPHYTPDRWLPHITLGYNNDITLEKLGPISQWLHQQAFNWMITIDNFHVLSDDSHGHIENLQVRFSGN